MSTKNRELLQRLYDAFNAREIETIIAQMRPDVKWANGLEGGFVNGRDEVRAYWTRQFESIRPMLETIAFETDDAGRDVVTVRQRVFGLDGALLADATVHQIFTVDAAGLIAVYEIGGTETIEEMIEKQNSPARP